MIDERCSKPYIAVWWPLVFQFVGGRCLPPARSQMVLTDDNLFPPGARKTMSVPEALTRALRWIWVIHQGHECPRKGQALQRGSSYLGRAPLHWRAMNDDDQTIVPAPGRGEYYLVKCPKLGKRRSSILCETTCYHTGLSTRKVLDERERCSSFQELKVHRENNPLPTWVYEEDDDDW